MLFYIVLLYCIVFTFCWSHRGGSARQTFQTGEFATFVDRDGSTDWHLHTIATFASNITGIGNLALPVDFNGNFWFSTDGEQSVVNQVAGHLIKRTLAQFDTKECEFDLSQFKNSNPNAADGGNGSPAICGELVILPIQQSVVAVNETDCTLVWHYAVHQNDSASPLTDSQLFGQKHSSGAFCDEQNGNVYFQSEIAITALDLTSGKQLWRQQLINDTALMIHSPAWTVTPALCNGIVYSTAVEWSTKHAFAAAFDANTGKQKWRTDLGDGNLHVAQPAIDAKCETLYIGTGGGVQVLDAATGLSAGDNAALGQCGADTVVLIEDFRDAGVINENGTSLLLTHSSGVFATKKCPASSAGTRIVALDGNETLVISDFLDAPIDMPIVADGDGKLFWCAAGTLNVMGLNSTNQYEMLLQEFAGCESILVDDNGMLVVRKSESLSVYLVTNDIVPSTTSTTTTLDTTSGTTLHTTLMPQTPATPAGDLEKCLLFVADCLGDVCPDALQQPLSMQTCYGTKCALYCMSKLPSIDCLHIVPDACKPPTDCMPAVDCNSTYANQFAPRSSGAPVTGTTTSSPVKEGDDDDFWVYLVVGLVSFVVIAVAIIAYCMIQHKKDKHRYVLLELDNSDDEF